MPRREKDGAAGLRSSRLPRERLDRQIWGRLTPPAAQSGANPRVRGRKLPPPRPRSRPLHPAGNARGVPGPHGSRRTPPAPGSPPGPGLAPPPQPGRGAGGEGARGGPAAPTVSPAPLLPLDPERKINPRVTTLSSFAVTHSRPGQLSSASLPRVPDLPAHPSAGGNPLARGRSRENGVRRGGVGVAEGGERPRLAVAAARDVAGTGALLLHLYRRQPR